MIDLFFQYTISTKYCQKVATPVRRSLRSFVIISPPLRSARLCLCFIAVTPRDSCSNNFSLVSDSTQGLRLMTRQEVLSLITRWLTSTTAGSPLYSGLPSSCSQPSGLLLWEMWPAWTLGKRWVSTSLLSSECVLTIIMIGFDFGCILWRGYSISFFFCFQWGYSPRDSRVLEPCPSCEPWPPVATGDPGFIPRASSITTGGH